MVKLRFTSNFSERKLERKTQTLNFRDKKSKEESAVFLVGGVMAGLYDIFPIVSQINDFIKSEESFSGKDIWKQVPQEERKLLLGRINELKSFLEKIEQKAKQ